MKKGKNRISGPDYTQKSIVVTSYLYPSKNSASRGIFVHQQAKYLARMVKSVDVITAGDHEDENIEVIDKVNVHRVSRFNSRSFFAGLSFAIKAAGELAKLNKTKKFDLVLQNFIGVNTLIFGILLRLMNKKFVVVSHGTGWELPKKNPMSNLMIKAALYFPQKVICVSRKTKELLSRNAGQRKLVVINNGVDPECLVPSKSKMRLKKELSLNKKLVLLSVANLVEKKGIDVIIRSLYNVHKEYPNIKYIIVGDGPLRENLQKLVDELKLADVVVFVGKKAGRELASFYNICDLFVLMSRDVPDGIESFGIVYIEASYFSKPVIGGKSGGTEDAVLDKKTGFLVNPEDSNQLEKTIILLLKNKRLRERLGAAGKKRVLKGFLWSHNARKLLNVAYS